MKRITAFILLACLLIGAVCYSQTFSGGRDLLPSIGSGELSSVKFGGGGKLKNWLDGSCPIFNGVNQWASTTADTAASTEYTVMMWLKPYGSTTNGRFLSTRVSAASASVDLFQSSVATLGASVSNVSFTAQSAPQGEWIHVALTKSAASATIYTNAIPRETKAVPAGQSLFDGEKSIGRYTTQYGNCSIAELSFWSRKLTDSDIARYKDKRLRGTESGLDAYYPMNEGSGAQTLIDKVGGKNAIASNSIIWTRRAGYSAPDVRSERYAISMDGVDDFAQTTASAGFLIPATTDAMSTELWFCPQTTAVESNKSIFSRYPTNADGDWGYVWAVTSGNLMWLVRNGGAQRAVLPPYAKKAEWLHALSVVAAGAQTIYINGVLATSTAIATTTMPAASGPVTLGAFGATLGNHAKVKVCEAAVWSRALTPAEAALRPYAKLTGSEAGLAAYWPCNEGTGTKLKNYSSLGTDADMTFVGAPTWVGRDIP